MLPARAATPPSARGEISAAAGDGGEIIPRRGRGDNHPGQSRRYAAARAATPPSPRGKSSGPEPPRGRQRGNHPGQSRHLAGDVGPVSRGDGGNQRGGRGTAGKSSPAGDGGDNHPGQSRRYAAARAATPPSGQGGNQRGGRGRRGNHPGQNGGKEIIRARAADMLPPEPLRRHPQGEIIPRRGRGTIIMLPARAATLPSGRGCMRYQRGVLSRDGPGMSAL